MLAEFTITAATEGERSAAAAAEGPRRSDARPLAPPLPRLAGASGGQPAGRLSGAERAAFFAALRRRAAARIAAAG